MTQQTLLYRTAHSEIDLKTVMPAGRLNMFTLGASTTLYGPSLVYIAQETGQSVANLGILFVFHWAGFFASTFTANRLARKLEMRRGAMVGVLLIAFGVLGLITLPFAFNLTMAFFVGVNFPCLTATTFIGAHCLGNPSACSSRYLQFMSASKRR